MTNEQMLQLRQFSIQAAMTLPFNEGDRIDFAEQVYTFVTQDVALLDQQLQQAKELKKQEALAKVAEFTKSGETLV